MKLLTIFWAVCKLCHEMGKHSTNLKNMQVKSYYPMFSKDKVFFLIAGRISFYVSRQAYEQIKQRGSRCYSVSAATRS